MNHPLVNLLYVKFDELLDPRFYLLIIRNIAWRCRVVVATSEDFIQQSQKFASAKFKIPLVVFRGFAKMNFWE